MDNALTTLYKQLMVRIVTIVDSVDLDKEDLLSSEAIVRAANIDNALHCGEHEFLFEEFASSVKTERLGNYYGTQMEWRRVDLQFSIHCIYALWTPAEHTESTMITGLKGEGPCLPVEGQIFQEEDFDY